MTTDDPNALTGAALNRAIAEHLDAELLRACGLPVETFNTQPSTAALTIEHLEEARKMLEGLNEGKRPNPPGAYAINGLDFDEFVGATTEAGITIEGYETPFEGDGWQYFVIEDTPLGTRVTPLFVVGTIERGRVSVFPQSMFNWTNASASHSRP